MAEKHYPIYVCPECDLVAVEEEAHEIGCRHHGGMTFVKAVLVEMVPVSVLEELRAEHSMAWTQIDALTEAVEAAESRCKGLAEALRELRESGMEHTTWRCTEPERYPEGCMCGLDETIKRVDALLAPYCNRGGSEVSDEWKEETRTSAPEQMVAWRDARAEEQMWHSAFAVTVVPRGARVEQEIYVRLSKVRERLLDAAKSELGPFGCAVANVIVDRAFPAEPGEEEGK